MKYPNTQTPKYPTGANCTAIRNSVFRASLGLWVFGYLGILGPLGATAPELTEATSLAIDKGLAYLLSVQNKDGSWDTDGKGTRAISTTSLALMAFMAKAQFPGLGPHGKELDRGMKWLLTAAEASSDGYLGTSMYEHGLATLALSEIWGMSPDPDDDDAIQVALEKAVEVILRSQNRGGGWRYQPQADSGQDTSCTMTVFHALASARQAGVFVPEATITKATKYFQYAHTGPSGGFTYMGEAGGRRRGELHVSSALTAGGSYCAQLAGERDSEMVKASLRYLKKEGGGGRYYYYAHYYAIHTMVQAGDDYYADWYPKIRDELIAKQLTTGGWAKAGGPAAHQTPMAIIVLATPHRYIPIYQR